ncbi:MAG: lasso peptide biosynthesis B2 protein [Wenzhouxiangella sp.]
MLFKIEVGGSLLLAIFFVWLLPFSWLEDWIFPRLGRRVANGADGSHDMRSLLQIRAYLARANQLMRRRTTCLTLAVAALLLLSRRRIPSVLYIGVKTGYRHDEPSSFQAHAWLVAGGRTVTGAEEASGCSVIKEYSFPE